jgi:hypothetical protein
MSSSLIVGTEYRWVKARYAFLIHSSEPGVFVPSSRDQPLRRTGRRVAEAYAVGSMPERAPSLPFGVSIESSAKPPVVRELDMAASHQGVSAISGGARHLPSEDPAPQPQLRHQHQLHRQFLIM